MTICIYIELKLHQHCIRVVTSGLIVHIVMLLRRMSTSGSDGHVRSLRGGGGDLEYSVVSGSY